MVLSRNGLPRVNSIPAENTPCPLCGSNGIMRGLRRGNRNYVFCRACRSFHLSPLPRRAELQAMFSDHYPREGSTDAQGALQAKILSELERWKPDKGRLLDIGAGYGHLVGLALARQWRVGALETVPACADYIENTHRISVVRSMIEDARLEPSSFDAVTMIDVVDQSQNPRRNVQTAASLLSPGGILFLRVRNATLHAPVTRFIQALHGPLQSRVWLPILHVWGLTSTSLVVLCRQAGLTPLRVFNGPWVAASSYGGGLPAALLKNAAFYGAEVVRRLSFGRALYGPSISVVARKPA